MAIDRIFLIVSKLIAQSLSFIVVVVANDYFRGPIH